MHDEMFFIIVPFSYQNVRSVTYHRFVLIQILRFVKMLRLSRLFGPLIFLPQSSITYCSINRHLIYCAQTLVFFYDNITVNITLSNNRFEYCEFISLLSSSIRTLEFSLRVFLFI